MTASVVASTPRMASGLRQRASGGRPGTLLRRSRDLASCAGRARPRGPPHFAYTYGTPPASPSATLHWDALRVRPRATQRHREAAGPPAKATACPNLRHGPPRESPVTFPRSLTGSATAPITLKQVILRRANGMKRSFNADASRPSQKRTSRSQMSYNPPLARRGSECVQSLMMVAAAFKIRP